MGKCIYIFCLIFVLQNVLSQSNNRCTTPNRHNGVCININRCPVLLSLLESQSKNSSIVSFLRSSLCGYEGEDPKVCCASNNNVSNNLNSPPNETVTSPKLPSQSTCGRNIITSDRIIGGQKSELGAWPWIAAIGYRDTYRPNNGLQWLCGGSLISDRYVLTAAHCTVGLGNRKLAIARLGELNLDPNVKDGASPVDIPVTRVITHEQYNAQRVSNDIALLKLEFSARYSDFIQPICLPVLPHIKNNNLVRKTPYVAGWGATEFRGPTSTALMEVPLTVFDEAKCKEAFSKIKSVTIDERVLCAGDMFGKKDSCQGDSGGPLMWPSGKQYYLVGIVSFGVECAKPGYPGVYTRVSTFVNWIVDNMNNS